MSVCQSIKINIIYLFHVK